MEFDSNNSPFLRLPAPHSNIILTPPRDSDGDAVIEILSDPRVYMNLAGPPFPYGQKEWDEWFPIIEKGAHDALLELREVEKAKKEGGSGTIWVKGASVNAIRELDPVTSEQKFIGIIGIDRRDFVFHDGNKETQMRKEENFAFEAGNPGITWELGCE